MYRLSGREMPPIKPRGLLLRVVGFGGLQSSHFLTTSVRAINRKGQSCMHIICSNRISPLIVTAPVRSCCRCFSELSSFYDFYKPCGL